MKIVRWEKDLKEYVYLDRIDENTPIFAKEKGKLVGMIVHENEGWILRLGGRYGCDGHHETRQKCMESSLQYGYTYYIEE